MEKALPMVADVLRRARAHHVMIVLGTDAVAGSHGRNFEEFIYRVKDGGDKPMDAIISGTSMAAASLRLGDKIGTVAKGFEADLVAVEGNPLEDITAVRKVVVRDEGRQGRQALIWAAYIHLCSILNSWICALVDSIGTTGTAGNVKSMVFRLNRSRLFSRTPPESRQIRGIRRRRIA